MSHNVNVTQIHKRSKNNMITISFLIKIITKIDVYASKSLL